MHVREALHQMSHTLNTPFFKKEDMPGLCRLIDLYFIYVYVCTCEFTCLWRPEEGIGFHTTVVVMCMGAGN